MDFTRNVVILAGGTALSQGILVIVSPLLTRLYTPEGFGVFGVYHSVFSLLTVVASLCYEQAIPLPKADSDAASLLVLSLVVVLATSIFSGLGALLLSEQITLWTNTPALEPYLWLIPVGVLGAGAYQALSYWMAREQRFAVLSYTRSARALGLVGTQVVLGLLRLGPIGLIAGYVASHLLGAMSLLRHSHLPRNAIAPNRWTALAKAYKDFPIFTVWTSAINVIGIQAPSVLFARYFALDIAGFFSQTLVVLGFPAALIGQAVAQVFYPKAARHVEEPLATREFIEQVSTSLLVLSFLAFSVVAIHGADLFAWVFGSQWRVAGRYAQYLAPWFMISFVSSPLSSFAWVKGRQKASLSYSCLSTLSRLGAIWLGHWYASPDLSVVLFSMVNVLFYLAYIAWILHLGGSSLGAWLKSIRTAILGGILLLAGLFVARHWLGPIISLVVSGVSLGLFGLCFWITSRRSAAGE